METVELYEKAIIYARNLINMRIYPLNKETEFDGEDLAAEAIIQGAKNIEDAKKVIRNEVLTEVRKLLAKRQMFAESVEGVAAVQSKVCKGCGQELPGNAFMEIVDNRSGFKYLHRFCHDCLREYKREVYAKSDKMKEQAKVRYERYKKRHAIKTKNKDTIQKRILRTLNFPKTRQELEKEYAESYGTKSLSATLSVLIKKGLVDKAPLKVVGERERYYYVTINDSDG